MAYVDNFDINLGGLLYVFFAMWWVNFLYKRIIPIVIIKDHN